MKQKELKDGGLAFVGQPRTGLFRSIQFTSIVLASINGISFHSQIPVLGNKLYGHPEPLPALDLPGSPQGICTQSLNLNISNSHRASRGPPKAVATANPRGPAAMVPEGLGGCVGGWPGPHSACGVGSQEKWGERWEKERKTQRKRSLPPGTISLV